MVYLPLVRLAYKLIVRPHLVKACESTANDVDDALLSVLDSALLVSRSK